MLTRSSFYEHQIGVSSIRTPNEGASHFQNCYPQFPIVVVPLSTKREIGDARSSNHL
jgi:hypothetical protein